jgi:hypothetical protein
MNFFSVVITDCGFGLKSLAPSLIEDGPPLPIAHESACANVIFTALICGVVYIDNPICSLDGKLL